MQKIIKKECPLHYLALNYTNLNKATEMILNAAQQGHWVLLEGLHNVPQYIPVIQKFLYQVFNFYREKKMKEQRTKRPLRDDDDEDTNAAMRTELIKIEGKMNSNTKAQEQAKSGGLAND